MIRHDHAKFAPLRLHEQESYRETRQTEHPVLRTLINVIFVTRGPLDHVLDAGIRCFGANKGGNKVEQPCKGTFSRWETLSQTLTKSFSIGECSVLHMDHPLDNFYEPHMDYFDGLPCNLVLK